MARQPQIRIGISGWTYEPWRGIFYPKKHPQHRELEYAAQMLNSIEINGSFYSLQRPSSYKTWYDATPANFVFSVKGGRYITHMKRLKDIEAPLANFFASGILALADRMGAEACGAGRTEKAHVAPKEIAKRYGERVRSHWPIAVVKKPAKAVK